MTHVSLVPKITGPEILNIEGQFNAGFVDDTTNSSFTAYLESGFDPDGAHHEFSDGPRYAIALAQIRRTGDYSLFDKAAELVRKFSYRVEAGKGFVRVIYEAEEDKKRRIREGNKKRRDRMKGRFGAKS